MPALSSRGGMSARGFGMFSGGLKLPTPTGDYVMFARGQGANVTVAYQLSNDALFTTTILTRNMQSSNAGVGNGNVGIFAIAGSSPGSTFNNKYVHATGVMTDGPALGNGNIYQGGACGNSVVGLICNGGVSPTATTTLYNYAADTNSGGSGLARTTNWTAMVGDSTRAIVSSASSAGSSTLTSQYTYANNATANATNFPVARVTGGAACGNSVKGVFTRTNVSGFNTQKYTYSNDATAAGGALGTAQSNIGQGGGNSAQGIIPAGASTGTNKYLYGSDTSAGSTAFAAVYNYGATVSNNIAGVNA